MTVEAFARAQRAMSEHIVELEHQLAEALARAEFAEDQLEVAIKDRDHAERQLAEARAERDELASQTEEWGAEKEAACMRADFAERQLADACAFVERLTRDRDEQWRDKLRERERSVEFVARIRDLESQVAELELTGDRAELRSLLDACGLDFERMRERALAAEHQLADARAALARLRSFVASVWYDEADATEEEREEMYLALAALKPASDKQWISGHVEGRSPTTGNGDEP